MQDFRAPVECLYSRIVQIQVSKSNSEAEVIGANHLKFHSQSNLNEVKQAMTSWAQAPLFVRKDGKKDTTLCIEEREERTKKRYAEMREVAGRIHE